MKKLIFILSISAFFSCSSSDEEEPMVMISESSVYNSYSPDSTCYFTASSDYIRKYKVTNTYPLKLELAKERPYYLQTKIINEGYGEYTTVTFSQASASVLENTIGVIAKADNYEELSITIYDYNLDSITSILSSNTNYRRWGWNNFLLIPLLDGQCIRYSERGELLETINGSSFYLPSTSDIILGDYTFIQLYENVLSKFHLVDGRDWVINLNDEIENKPSTETNLPKISIASHSISGTTLTFNLNATYYSGEKENITIKVNSETGEIL